MQSLTEPKILWKNRVCEVQARSEVVPDRRAPQPSDPARIGLADRLRPAPGPARIGPAALRRGANPLWRPPARSAGPASHALLPASVPGRYFPAGTPAVARIRPQGSFRARAAYTIAQGAWGKSRGGDSHPGPEPTAVATLALLPAARPDRPLPDRHVHCRSPRRLHAPARLPGHRSQPSCTPAMSRS